MIRFQNVTRSYPGGGDPALKDVTVEFYRGEFVFLIGASGSGKSTLLRMILREGLPSKGKLTVAGQNLGLMLERRVPEYRRSVGMVFQDFRLLPDKTVFDNVAFAMRVTGAPRGQIRRRVMKILKRVGLDHLVRRYPHEISGGEQQRAAIARAVVNAPAILLADEPTGNLDPRASDEVMKVLRWINASGTTVVMATHDRAIVDRFSKRVVQLHDGELVRDANPGGYDAPEGSRAWELLVEEQAESRLRAHDPAPVFTQAVPQVRREQTPQPAPSTAAAADPAQDPAPTVQRKILKVSWPEDQQDDDHHDDADSDAPPPQISAADVPRFDQDTAGSEEPEADTETDAVHTVQPAAEEQRPRLSWLAGTAADPESTPPPERTPDATDQPEPGPESASTPADQPSKPVPRPVPRPKSSAAQTTYSDARRTAEQLKPARGLFGRRRRK